MRIFWRDKIAIVSALIGVILMILTIAWRINPVEGSVMPSYLTGNFLGSAVICVLIATSVPSWVAILPFTTLVSMLGITSDLLVGGTMILIQGVVYFMIGKLLSLCVKRFSIRKDSSNKGM
jgi:hypothetical protein